MRLTFEEFLNYVKVIRMLYGVQIAKNVFEFGLDNYNLDRDILTTPRDTKKKDNA